MKMDHMKDKKRLRRFTGREGSERSTHMRQMQYSLNENMHYPKEIFDCSRTLTYANWYMTGI